MRTPTLSLFFETCPPKERNRLKPKYTLKRKDHEYDGVKYKSMYKLYLNSNDVTEYEFVQKTLGDWQHWKVLCRVDWFIPYVEAWREELEVKMRSNAIRHIIDDSSNEDSKSSTVSAKWVAEKGWEKGKGKGRPSKDTINREANKLIRIDEEIDADIERMENMH